MKKLNDNRAAMIRAEQSLGFKCQLFANNGQLIYSLLLKGEDATESDLKVLINCFGNNISFLKAAIGHYEKAQKITQSLLR